MTHAYHLLLIYGIWPQASKQANIYTHVRNAVPLVWGSLRLAPIICYLFTVGRSLVWPHIVCVPTNLLLFFHTLCDEEVLAVWRTDDKAAISRLWWPVGCGLWLGVRHVYADTVMCEVCGWVLVRYTWDTHYKRQKKKKKKERKGEEKERERKEKKQKEGEQKKRLFSLHVKLPVEPSAFVSLVPAQHSPILIQSHPLVVPLLQNIT